MRLVLAAAAGTDSVDAADNFQQTDQTMTPHRLPLIPPEAPLREGYLQLRAEIDACAALLIRRHQSFITCAPGCSSCCSEFSIVALEAALIAEQLTRPRSEPQATAAPVKIAPVCGLLIDHHCSIYPHRPIICRTQGLPIAYVDEALARIEVSACPLNFVPEHPFEHDDLLFLDPYNGRLAELNHRYCLAHKLDPTARLVVGCELAPASDSTYGHSTGRG